MTWAPTVVADPLAALVAHVRAQLPALGGRVYGDRLPGAQTAGMPQQGAVLRQVGGPGAARHLPLLTLRIDAHVYGPTPYQAAQASWQLHGVLNDLRRVEVGGTLLHSCAQEMAPAAQTDPETEWPEVVSSWLLLAAEHVAA